MKQIAAAERREKTNRINAEAERAKLQETCNKLQEDVARALANSRRLQKDAVVRADEAKRTIDGLERERGQHRELIQILLAEQQANQQAK